MNDVLFVIIALLGFLFLASLVLFGSCVCSPVEHSQRPSERHLLECKERRHVAPTRDYSLLLGSSQ